MLRSFLLRQIQDIDYYREINILTENEAEEINDAEVCDIEFELSSGDGANYDVFQLSLDICSHEIRLLKSFEHAEAALIYCEEQYTLFNGKPPMIESDDYAKFNLYPMGKIAEVDINDDMECKIVVNGASDADEYLVIISHDYFAAYALAGFSMWRKPTSS